MMGVKSTYRIKRKIAISIIYSKLEECSNIQLENILEEFDESEYRNYVIATKSNSSAIYVINSIDDFNKKDVV